jgi:hypothetical protein
MNTSDRTVRETPYHIQAEWYFLSPHACPCSSPNKSHVIHSLRPCRNSPLSKTKLNSHTTFWNYIWFERYLRVFSECSYYHKHYEMRSSSFNEKHHSTSHSSKCQWLNKKLDIFSYTFIIHIPSFHLFHLLYMSVLGRKNFFCFWHNNKFPSTAGGGCSVRGINTQTTCCH